LPKDISKNNYSNKRTFASLVTEQLDTLSNLSKLTFTSNLSQEVIARELSNIIRIISVNLEYGNSPISSLREINELVLEINTFLEKSFDQGLISNEILEKNRLSLCRTLSSCNRLPSEFIRDLVSHLSG
jgi:vacuolar-type H+-ATPase subunit I/STV1